MAMRTRTKVLLILAILFFAGIGSLYSWYRYEFPYGASHCCDLGIWFTLREYAETHGGRFPAGEATPEASLSLVYRAGLLGETTLRGKTVPESVVREILEGGGLLGPDTCGWHYVEGLTLADDPRLALFWDKAGLGHNGQRLRNGDRFVSFVGEPRDLVPGEKWSEFLQEQEKLLAARSKAAIEAIPLLTAKVRLPSGEVVDHYDGPFNLEHESRSGAGSASGDKLYPQALRWWQLAEVPGGSGTQTLTLTLGPWRSKPVEISVSRSTVTPSSFLFEMTAPDSDPPQRPAAPAQPR